MSLTIEGKRNKVPYCLKCGIPITLATDSGWEAFTPDGKTQALCAVCDIEYSKGGPKNEK